MRSPMTETGPNLWDWWKGEFQRHPVLLFWLIVFVVHAGMNANLGYVIGGGEGFPAFAYAVCFLGFAGLGAWAADQWLHGASQWRAGLLIMALAQFGIGQMAGWQSFGLTLERGAAGLESQADQRRTAKDKLKRQRDEREGIGTVRPIASIEAEENLECQIKSKIYRDGVGPKCTKLRAELASAKRAAELDTAIGESATELGGAARVNDPNALYAAPQAIAQVLANAASLLIGGKARQVTPDDVRFGWMVFLVAALEFFGTFGLAIIRSFGRPGPAGSAGPGPFVAPSDAHSASGASRHGGAGDGARDMRSAVEAVLGGSSVRGIAAPDPVPLLGAPRPPDAQWASEGGRVSAPINIHFAVPQALLPAPHAANGQDAGPAASGQPKGHESAHARGAVSAPAGATLERTDLPALPADAPPVDRSRVGRALAPEEREAADVILAFRAACVVEAPGGVVSGKHLYGRYAYWAGPRALEEPAFAELFADLTGHRSVEIGGLGHWQGIALRAAPALQAVA